MIAASLGWLLDAFDVMLYALVLPAVMADLGLSRTVGGLLGSATLAASAVGGVLFGIVADRWGRRRALIWSVLLYSVFTAACGLAQSVLDLAIFRVLLGFGMGGEWASGAALVSETWPDEHRGKALGLMQSAWAVGYAAAAGVSGLVQPRWGWRAVFFVGILPALFTLWIRRRVREPELWERTRRRAASPRLELGRMVRRPAVTVTAAVTLMNACTMYAWWGFNLWIPAYLSLPRVAGGVGLSPSAMAGLVVAMQVGMWIGYVSFGFIADALGRKRAYVGYLLTAAILIWSYASTRHPLVLLGLGPLVAFFGTGYFSGFGAVTAELYPTSIRATAQGFTYNVGRLASAVAPFVVGRLSDTHGFGLALSTSAIAFLLAAACWLWIPETKGRSLA